MVPDQGLELFDETKPLPQRQHVETTNEDAGRYARLVAKNTALQKWIEEFCQSETNP